MDWFYIGIFFIQRSRDVGIDGSVGWEVQGVIDIFFDVYAIVFPGVFVSNFDKLDNSNVSSFLDLTKETIVIPRTPA